MDKEKNGLPPPQEVDGFQIPEGYFEQLQQDVLDRVEQDAQPRLRWLNWSVAATVALLITCGSYFFLQQSSPTKAALSQQDALEYIENNIDEFEEDLLISDWDDFGNIDLHPSES